MAKGTRDQDLDRGLPPSTPVSWAMSRSSSGVTPETSMVTYSTPLTAISAIASWSRGKSRRPTPAASLRCRIIRGVLSPVPFVGSASTFRMSATTSNACRRSSKARILARALARALARTVARKRTNLAKASRKAVGKAKTRAKVDKEEALTARKIGITRTKKGPEATPTLIQGGTPSPLEGSLVPGRPHARRLRPKKSKGPSEDMKVVTIAKLRREPASCGWPAN